MSRSIPHKQSRLGAQCCYGIDLKIEVDSQRNDARIQLVGAPFNHANAHTMLQAVRLIAAYLQFTGSDELTL
ncbi:hypothetical protein F9K88_01290 [Brucella intermedia]|uniref:Uncharacterized protein n=2 Tax=Brucella TaxID=234 RepID=M5JVU0_9HYPH|nr:hypothetical protein D584_13066 [Brucella intermedia M86]KAB2714259.1 hypothetical protein F9K88_01290 [Brucella intermedia]NKC28465.1 hypothetical protein [Brucella ciceri]PJT23431.1 hypothetical protein CN884_09715 [Ochrobactrum sp. 30A/1000/2015]PJT37938.1 hypothetical protein CN883_14115 [Ochrobactrum sp. 27A/999/2015]PJT41471.1 hypothetical protein CN882_17565 [Ochrobactrum sp. 23A/997/2015]